MWTKNFQMYQLDLEKAEEPEIKMPTVSSWIIEKAKELKKNTKLQLDFIYIPQYYVSKEEGDIIHIYKISYKI